MKTAVWLVALALVAGTAAAQKSAKTISDSDIKKAIMLASISSYAGSCPCPYNVDRGGRRCGKRSAYSRPGGAAPICYEEDVTPAMIEAFRKRTK